MANDTQDNAMRILEMATSLTVQVLQSLSVNNAEYEIPEGFLAAQLEQMVNRLLKHHETVTQYLQLPSDRVTPPPSPTTGVLR